MKAAIYARVSSADQTCENQLLELRRYCGARGWDGRVRRYGRQRSQGPPSGTRSAHGRCEVSPGGRGGLLRLDRFGRSLRALIVAIEDLNAAGVGFVSMGE